jgi:hypothetical protein
MSINKALCWAEVQSELLVLSGDHETAKEIVLMLAKARAALIDEE